MLVLTRRVNEAVKIGDNITITVIGYRGGQVRLGISAPRNITAHREEVYNRIQREQAQEHEEEK
jgi:carbon storage regulator